MIVSIGLANRNDVAFKLAEVLADLNAPISFLGPFSQEDTSMELLNYLIDKCVLFDPVFCNTDGNKESITKERLIKAFAANSDIEFVVVSKDCYDVPCVKKDVDEAVKTVNARFYVISETDDLTAVAQSLVAKK